MEMSTSPGCPGKGGQKRARCQEGRAQRSYND